MADPKLIPPARPPITSANSMTNAARHSIRLVSYSPPRPEQVSSAAFLSVSAGPDPHVDVSRAEARPPEHIRSDDAKPTAMPARPRANLLRDKRLDDNPRTPGLQNSRPGTAAASSADPTAPISKCPSQKRRGRIVKLHSNKTFSIDAPAVPFLPLRNAPTTPTPTPTPTTPTTPTAAHMSAHPLPPLPYAHSAAISSQDRFSSSDLSTNRRSSILFSEDQARTSTTSVLEPSLPFGLSASTASSTTQVADVTSGDKTDPSSASPWNYRLVGGVRKVPKSPRLQLSSTSHPFTLLSDQNHNDLSPPKTPTALSATEGSNGVQILATPPPPPSLRQPAASFQASPSSTSSYPSDMLESETTNYNIYANSSPPSSGAAANAAAVAEAPTARSSSEDSNYRVLAVTPPSTSASSDLPVRSIRADPASSDWEASQASPLAGVAILRGNLHGDVTYSDASSSPSSSIRTIETGPRFSRESLIVPPLMSALRKPPSDQPDNIGLLASESREPPPAASATESVRRLAFGVHPMYEPVDASFTESLPFHYPERVVVSGAERVPIGPSPHQWSSQLSTVPSESESDRGFNSRPVSTSSAAVLPPGRHNSRSSQHSQARPPPLTLSSSSAYARLAIPGSVSPVYVQTTSDQDEAADVLGNLRVYSQPRPLRSRLPSLLSTVPSDRNLQSSGSARANSLYFSSFPAWAKLYYGSGERRLPYVPSSDSLYTAFRDGFPAGMSPIQDSFGQGAALFSPHRGPRDGNGMAQLSLNNSNNYYQSGPDRPVSSFHTVADFSQAGQPGVAVRPQRAVRHQSSSIWSPHLRHDGRPVRYSLWEAPSATWSIENSPFGRRNVQVVCFVLGFVLPLAWIFAACRPLPPRPTAKTSPEMAFAAAELGLDSYAFVHHEFVQRIDQTRYDSARWWRRLNRLMSLLGVSILIVVVVLIVLGVGKK